ncbi:MAG: DUF2799 domain-containing protein [Pseudomonadota bacterium]
MGSSNKTWWRAIVVALLLSSCATMSEEECRITNWNARGQADGQNGAAVGRFQDYTKACSRYSIAPDFTAWEAGRQRGLERYCTPQGVYAAARRLSGNPGECGFDPTLNRIFRVASRYAALERELFDARRDYDSLLRSFDFDRRNARVQRRRLSRDDLSDKDRRDAERSLENSEADLDAFPFRQQDALFRLSDIERTLDRAQFELFELEREFGL